MQQHQQNQQQQTMDGQGMEMGEAEAMQELYHQLQPQDPR